jgi:hypothetical protein
MGDQPVAKPLRTQDSITEKRGHASKTGAGFEPTIRSVRAVEDRRCPWLDVHQINA